MKAYFWHKFQFWNVKRGVLRPINWKKLIKNALGKVHLSEINFNGFKNEILTARTRSTACLNPILGLVRKFRRFTNWHIFPFFES